MKEEIAEVLVIWTQQLIDDMVMDLHNSVLSKRNALAQSITPNYIVTDTEISMEMSINDYYMFVDQGVSGLEVNISGSPFKFKSKFAGTKMAKSMAEWITDAGVQVPSGKKKIGKKTVNYKGDIFKRRQQFSWAIATNKKKTGLKAKPFFNKNLTEDRITQLQTMLQEKLSINISVTLLE